MNGEEYEEAELSVACVASVSARVCREKLG